jgi:inward rectifier potassium channel
MRHGRTYQGDDVVVVGARPHPLRDAYHLVLRMRLGWLVALLAGAILTLNVVFALVYLEIGGVSGAAHGSFRDAFFFSVQTMGTIGYGALYPTSTATNSVVTVESIVSIMTAALVTGVVFARFSQSTGQLVFSDKVVISPMNGVPTLAFRVGNDRASTVFEARVRAAIIRTEKTDEGVTFYRLTDLALARETSLALARSWTVMHPIDEKSPLYRATPDSCEAQELELVVTIVGTDDTSLQPVHGRTRYHFRDIVWGARLADVLSELPDGRLQLDIREFDAVVPTEPTATFPYPR